MNNIQKIEQILLAILGKEVGEEKIKHIIVSFTEKREGDILSEEQKQEAFLKELKNMLLEKIQHKAQEDYMNESFRGIKQVREESIRGL